VLGERVDPCPIVHHSSHIDFQNSGSDKEKKVFVAREIFCSSVGGLIHTGTLNVGACYLWGMIYSYSIHSFRWHVQNAAIPCCSQELLPFLSVIHFSLPPFSTNCSSILPHFILPSISWSTSQYCCFQIHI